MIESLKQSLAEYPDNPFLQGHVEALTNAEKQAALAERDTENHIMLDIETLGTRPGSIVLSIGAAAFDREAVRSIFHVRIDPRSAERAGLKADVETIAWWMDQSSEAKKELSLNGVPLEIALDQFREFFELWKNDGRRTYLWGNGVAFDNVLLRCAYEAAGMPVPWEHWEDRCYRTVKGMLPCLEPQRHGTHHNAADDAVTQASHLIEIWKRIDS